MLFASSAASPENPTSVPSPQGASKQASLLNDASILDQMQVLRDQLEQQSWEVNRALVERLAGTVPFDSPELREVLLLAARHTSAQGQHGESIFYYERWCQAGKRDGRLPQVLVELGKEYRDVELIRSAVECF